MRSVSVIYCMTLFDQAALFRKKHGLLNFLHSTSPARCSTYFALQGGGLPCLHWPFWCVAQDQKNTNVFLCALGPDLQALLGFGSSIYLLQKEEMQANRGKHIDIVLLGSTGLVCSTKFLFFVYFKLKALKLNMLLTRGRELMYLKFNIFRELGIFTTQRHPVNSRKEA